MLEYLHVKNLALIKEAELELSPGLNILSGETGAGKSILLGSINLALGSRKDTGLIRTGETYAYVELVFGGLTPETEKKLIELDVYPEDGRVIISRRITEGKSQAKINGESVTNAALKKVSDLLISIHGQHEHQTLLSEEHHLDVLQAYGKKELAAYMENYAENYRNYKKVKDAIRSMGEDDEGRRRQIDFLEFQIDEIEGAEIIPGEEERITENYRKLASAEELSEGLQKIRGDFAEEISGMLSDHLHRMESLVRLDPDLRGIQTALLDMEELSSDLVREIDGKCSEIEPDEEKQNELQERLTLLQNLKKKYGNSEADILNALQAFRVEYDALIHFEEHKEELQEKLAEEKKKLLSAAHALHTARQEAAERFQKEMCEALQDLNFLEVHFEVLVEETNRYTPKGGDQVQFLISLNPGEPLKPLQKVASGGELSRIMLAIKTLTVSADDIDTMIFDEIDAGISGKTAWAVGQKMQDIAKEHQVICISHLPQIVSSADHHFLIEKNAVAGSTVTSISELNPEESLHELARLLTAGEETETSLKNAMDMREKMKHA